MFSISTQPGAREPVCKSCGEIVAGQSDPDISENDGNVTRWCWSSDLLELLRMDLLHILIGDFGGGLGSSTCYLAKLMEK